MKIAVLVDIYPSEDSPYPMAYVHSRNIVYQDYGHIVKVFSFAATKEYMFEGVQVFPFNFESLQESDIILAHAPTKQHYNQAFKYLENKKIILFFHGHEVLYFYGDYPKPYPWVDVYWHKKLYRKTVDYIKMIQTRVSLRDIAKKNQLGFIFVSNWMKKQFIKNIKINPADIGQVEIIHNASNPIFFQKKYEFDERDYKADYITIRPLDKSKYAIDLVVDFALNNPDKKFHIYGKGDYFNYNIKPKNIQVIDQFIRQEKIPEILNKYKCAIMPTRYDAQGVMVCEMTTYGIPIITTDFEVCLDMLDGFKNVSFLKDYEFSSKKADEILFSEDHSKEEKFKPNNLVTQELTFFESIR